MQLRFVFWAWLGLVWGGFETCLGHVSGTTFGHVWGHTGHVCGHFGTMWGMLGTCLGSRWALVGTHMAVVVNFPVAMFSSLSSYDVQIQTFRKIEGARRLLGIQAKPKEGHK